MTTAGSTTTRRSMSETTTRRTVYRVAQLVYRLDSVAYTGEACTSMSDAERIASGVRAGRGTSAPWIERHDVVTTITVTRVR